MKIAIITDSEKRADGIRQMLEAEGASHSVSIVEGGLDRLGPVLDQGQVDLSVLDVDCWAESEMAILEKLSQRHPHAAFILLCPTLPSELLIQAMRIGVRDVLPAAVSPQALMEAVARVGQKPIRAEKPQHKGKVLAFIACKGGSGATFLAANLGYVLAAEHGKRVALIDLNLQFGDASLFISDRVPATTLADVAHEILRLDASFLASSLVQILPNYGVLAAPENPTSGADVLPGHIEVLLRLAMAEYDYVILDVGRNLDAVSVKALDYADLIFPVLQMTLPFIRDAKRLISTLQSLGYGRDKIHLIVNRYEKGDEIQLGDVERTLGMKLMVTFPNSYEAVSASVNQGVPILKMAKRDPVSKTLLKLGQDLEQGEQAGKSGWLGHLFGRA